MNTYPSLVDSLLLGLYMIVLFVNSNNVSLSSISQNVGFALPSLQSQNHIIIKHSNSETQFLAGPVSVMNYTCYLVSLCLILKLYDEQNGCLCFIRLVGGSCVAT